MLLLAVCFGCSGKDDGKIPFFRLVPEGEDRILVIVNTNSAISEAIGDYSVGINSGLYVENGGILGRVKDVMIAGNAYETLSNVIAVGDTLSPSAGGYFPVVLCDNVSVSA